MIRPWNNWYHCNGNTYGTWLPGDPRGYRTLRHKTHVEGDYRRPPPPGIHDTVLQRSRRLMSHEPVKLNVRQRRMACVQMAARLLTNEIKVIAVSVDDHHFHILAKCPDHRPRYWIGRAKFHASMVLRGDKEHRRIWAKTCRALPIKDRAHQVNVFKYIVNHAKQGAAVWTFREPTPMLIVTRSTRNKSS